jgi:hypothetical protein
MDTSTALTTTTTIDTTAALAIPTGDPIDQFAAHLALDVAAGQISADTAAAYVRGLRRFVRWAAASGDSLTVDGVKRWLADLRISSSSASIAVWFGGLRAFAGGLSGSGCCWLTRRPA